MSKIKTFHLGGINLEKLKLSHNIPITDVGIPDVVNIPVRQHIGAPAKIIVKKGDKVKVGTLIADADGILSADVHSSVSGEIIKIDEGEGGTGYLEQMISIKVEGDEWESDIDKSPDIIKEFDCSAEKIVEIIRSAGIVGMGGAGFPTPIKTTIPEGKRVDVIILNGIECEPYLTNDDRLMVEYAEQIIIGAKILNKALGIQRAIIAIDENKREAIEIMSNLTRRYVGVNVEVCATKYPQGAEKQLIEAITGREIPPGCLPIDVNCLVQNVATVFAVYEAVQKNKPLFERVITVSGDNVESPANYRVRIGTPVSYIVNKLKTVGETGKILLGGPMMGVAATNLEAPVRKITSGILLLKKDNLVNPIEKACIRCAKCVDVCPQGLQPYLIADYMKNGMYQEAKRIHALDCIECGCCDYTCPAQIPLLDYIKLAKYEIKKKR